MCGRYTDQVQYRERRTSGWLAPATGTTAPVEEQVDAVQVRTPVQRAEEEYLPRISQPPVDAAREVFHVDPVVDDSSSGDAEATGEQRGVLVAVMFTGQ